MGNSCRALLPGADRLSYPFKRAGLDLTTAAPYEALVQRMNATLDEVERLIAAPS